MGPRPRNRIAIRQEQPETPRPLAVPHLVRIAETWWTSLWERSQRDVLGNLMRLSSRPSTQKPPHHAGSMCASGPAPPFFAAAAAALSSSRKLLTSVDHGGWVFAVDFGSASSVSIESKWHIDGRSSVMRYHESFEWTHFEVRGFAQLTSQLNSVRS